MSCPLALLADLVLSRRCVGCSTPDTALCRSCLRSLDSPRPHRPEPCPHGMPATWVAGGYDGAVRAAVLAVKEQGRADVLPVLAGALAGAVRSAVEAGPAHSGPVLLVPIPSARAAARRRGGDHVRLLARCTAAQLQREGWPAAVLPALRLTRVPRDSAGLTAVQRAVNLQGIFTAAPQAGRLAGGCAVVVVDDIVTTGTTFTQAAAALRRRGVPVAAAAVAATARRSPRRVSDGQRRD